MKAAVLYELNQPVVVEDIEMEGPKAGEVVVKVAATGVCHSFQHSSFADYPGHNWRLFLYRNLVG